MRIKKGGYLLLLFLLAVAGIHAYAAEYSPEEHEYSDWTVNLASTCTEIGERYKVCLLHGGRIIEELAPAGHQYELEVTDASCTEEERRVYVCSVCGDSYEEEGEEALGHDFRPGLTREAACEQEGTLTYSCTWCEEEYTEIIPMLSHSYGKWKIEKQPEVGIEGRRYQECLHCGKRIYETVQALTAEPLPEESAYQITPLDITLVAIDIGIFAVFLFFIQMDIALILWNRRQRKEYEKTQERIRKYGDGCGFY